MSIEKIDKKIETYQVSKHFFVDVEEHIAFGNKMFVLYLYHEDYGIKKYMIRVYQENMELFKQSIEDVIAQDLIENICAYYTAYIKPGYFDEKIAIAQFINDFDI